MIVTAFLLGATAGALNGQFTGEDRFVPPIAGTWDPVESMGQPPRWKPFIGFGFGMDRLTGEPQVGATGSLGFYRDIVNPVFGLLGGTAQAYFGQRGERLDGGVRLYASAPALFLHAGVDWNARLERSDFVLSVSAPPLRGGWFRRGGELRVDWVPGREQSLVIGTTVPLGQRFSGRTRPRSVDVELPRPPAARRLPPPPPTAPAHTAVLELRHSIEWIGNLHNIFWMTEPRALRQSGTVERMRQVLGDLRLSLAARDSLLPGRNTYEREIEYYHATLDRAFGLALGAAPAQAEAHGTQLADRARHIALVEVVLPYNRTIGQYKQPDVLDGLIARARARFVATLELENGSDEHDSRAALQVFDAWLTGFEQLRQWLARLTNDSRMQWLPLGLVMRANEHQTREQIDRIIELALGREILGGNATLYINAPQFQPELERSIHEAQVYHVLWIHDFRGRNEMGEPDRAGFEQMTNGYMRALLNRVREYDDTGRLPVFILMLDQHSYEIYDSRIWLDVLERPLTHRAVLPPQFTEMQQTFDALQDSLRQAVRESRRLSAEVVAFGEEWVERVIKVHVNVTNPSDFSFRSRRLLGLPIGGDNLMRDHRKIVIRDVTESDPALGEVILTGVGVGEKYRSATWEDRGVIIHGPAALGAKTAAREVLQRNGLGGDALPQPLRPQPFALDYAQRITDLEATGMTARVTQAHNRTGWGAKDATYVQMLLYDLAPAGTVIYVPDSLWTNYEWLAQLVSAALRGCLVFVVAPAAEHAPSAGFPQMSVMHDLMTRLVIVQEQLGSVIREAHGELHVGFYTRRAAMDDLPARLREAEENLARHEFLRRIFPFAAGARNVMQRFAAGESLPDLPDDARGRPPQMHRKTQLIASAPLLAALARSDDLPAVLDGLLQAETEYLVRTPESGPLPQQERFQPSLRLLDLYRSLPRDMQETEPLYFMVGSLNKDVRSMALDGEAIALVTGGWALQPYVDFFLLSGAVTWVDSVEAVHELLPPYRRWQRVIGRMLHRVL
jgi:hypothetical protein